MLEEKRDLCLVEEHGNELVVLNEARQDAFDRNRLFEALNRFRYTTENLGHSACVNPLCDGVTIAHECAEMRRKRHRCRLRSG